MPDILRRDPHRVNSANGVGVLHDCLIANLHPTLDAGVEK
jgi:hypothetical protein